MFEINYCDNFDVDYDKSLLIVIDMVKGFTDIGVLKSDDIKNIASNIRKYGEKFSNIISINDNHNEDDCEFNVYPKHCVKNSEEVELCKELRDLKFTDILFKNSTNAFFSHGFLEKFKCYIENGFDFIVSGCCSDICVMQFCLTFKAYLNSINKNLNIIVHKSLIETYDALEHPKDKSTNAALYLMQNMGIIITK